jgi:hypothetical protein
MITEQEHDHMGETGPSLLYHYIPDQEDMLPATSPEVIMVPAQYTIHSLLASDVWRLIAATPTLVPAIEIAHFWHWQFCYPVEVRDAAGTVVESLSEQL